MHGRLHALNALLLAALIGGSVLVWPDLPDRIPGHFGADGEITRWNERSLWTWLLVPLLALGSVTLHYLVAGAVARWPRLLNHPDKNALLALPPERQRPIIARVQALLYGMSALLVAIFGALQWTRYRTALGADPEPYIALHLVLAALMVPLGLALWLPPISREIQDQTRRHALATREE